MRDGVVDTLLAAGSGDELDLEAQNYDWASPFEVCVEEDVTFETLGGDTWQVRRLSLDSTADNGGTYTVIVVEGCPPPATSSAHGPLVGADNLSPNIPPYENLGPRKRETVDILGVEGEVEPNQLKHYGIDHNLPAALHKKGIADYREHPDHGNRRLYSLSDAAREAYADIEFEFDGELPSPSGAQSAQRGENYPDRDVVEAAIEVSDTLHELADELDSSTERVLRLLGHYDLDHHILGDGSAVEFKEVERVQDELGGDEGVVGDA